MITNAVYGILRRFIGTDLVISLISIVNITDAVVIGITYSFVATIIVVIVRAVDFKGAILV